MQVAPTFHVYRRSEKVKTAAPAYMTGDASPTAMKG